MIFDARRAPPTRRAARGAAIALMVILGLLAGDGSAQLGRPPQPEPASGRTAKTLAHAREYMVAAAHPLAVDAGGRMLAAGGSAMDAAIATQLVLNLVESHASGLGGGAFLLHYDAPAGVMRAYDGRETAPAGATPELFLRTDGEPMSFQEAVPGGRSVGVPGLARLLELAHRRHGRLAWSKLFEPAIALAEQGYPISERVHLALTRAQGLARDATARQLFFDADGNPKAAGTFIRNPAFAATLRAIARDGAAAFYRGDIARAIVAAVRGHPSNPGTLSEQDLADYSVREVTPLCGAYRQFRVCGMPPSSSGGIAVLQMLGMLSRFDLGAVRPESSRAAHLLAEAGRLAFADRNRYVADDRFVEVPVQGLLDPKYLATRSQRIRPEASMGKAEPGVPPGVRVAYAGDAVDEAAGTSHIGVVDRHGNAVSMTTTIESLFGARIMAGGFLLNNQLTDFNFAPSEDGRPVANRVEPGKRPRSSMAPTLVFDAGGRLHLALGSPGGSLIINYVLKTLVATLDWKLDVQAAIDLPNVGSRNGPTELERGTSAEALAATLQAMGHPLRVMDMTSGVHAIMRAGEGWTGGADPRREGVARGR
ncbi:MAG: gamma-glutamyltransferase [Burkholderiales bacterium]|nr:gamma-glutamyltransferase [Burkholderiales bacterium]